MQAKPQVFIRARAMTGLQPLVHALGGDVVALMDKFNLDAALLDQPDAILPLDRLSALMEDAALALNCPLGCVCPPTRTLAYWDRWLLLRCTRTRWAARSRALPATCRTTALASA